MANYLDEDFLEELKSFKCQDRSPLPRFTHKLNVFRLCNDEVYGLKPQLNGPIIPVTYDLLPPAAGLEFVTRLFRSIGDEYKPINYVGVLRISYGSLTIINHVFLHQVSSDLLSDNWGIYEGDLSQILNLYQKYNKFVDITVGANYLPAITQSEDLIGWARLQTDITPQWAIKVDHLGGDSETFKIDKSSHTELNVYMATRYPDKELACTSYDDTTYNFMVGEYLYDYMEAYKIPILKL